MQRLRFVLAPLAALALAVASAPPASAGGGCHARAETTDGTGVLVNVKDCGFAPVVLHAPVNGTITWSNGDYLPHVISGVGWGSTPSGAETSLLQPGESYKRQFDAPGIYPYTCYLHPGMSGVVLVGDLAVTSGSGGAMPVATAASRSGPEVPVAAAGVLMALAVGAGYALAALRRMRVPLTL